MVRSSLTNAGILAWEVDGDSQGYYSQGYFATVTVAIVTVEMTADITGKLNVSLPSFPPFLLWFDKNV